MDLGRLTVKLTPSELINFRAECYRNMDGRGVFSLYSEKSDMAKLFTEDSFAEHFTTQTKNCTHAGVKIVAEKSRGTMVEVTYMEYINDGDVLITYYSKTVFVDEDDRWKILKEQREIRKNAISVNG